MKVRRTFRFEAAHRLPRHAGRCRGLHGHSYALTVALEGPVEPGSGMVVDFDELEAIVRSQVLERLDHRCLNDLVENPTAENLAVWIWERLRDRLPRLAEVELAETHDCSVVYRGE